jgi:Na+/proline symporter
MAGELKRLNVVELEFDPNSRYNLWSGLLGGAFLALSYFGTDQSQVQRYLAGRSVTESRMALVMNGLVKVPMQFCILLIGALMFVFYQFHPQPIFFNEVERTQIRESAYGDYFRQNEAAFEALHQDRQSLLLEYERARESGASEKAEALAEQLRSNQQAASDIKTGATLIMQARDPNVDTNDLDYVFLTYVLNYLPSGLVGLLISVILMASMSSTSGELNALASTTMVDVYQRFFRSRADDRHYLRASRWVTAAWGVYAILFAQFAGQLGNLIQAVNILGSLFYGSILGIFLVAFYLRHIGGTPVFLAAVLSQSVVFAMYAFTEVAYLWYNIIGCGLVVGLSALIQRLQPGTSVSSG